MTANTATSNAQQYLLSYPGHPNGYDRALVQTTPSVESITAFCNAQSWGADIGFCAMQALYLPLIDDRPNHGVVNRDTRRVSNQPSSTVSFEVESFYNRINQLPSNNQHYWFCYRNSPSGWGGQCYMEGVPETGFVASGTNAPMIRYYVPVPVMYDNVTYGVWVRGCGQSSNQHNWVQIGIGGQRRFAAGGWRQCSQGWEMRRIGAVSLRWNDTFRAYHEFNIWMYDDGVKIDRVQLIQE